MQTPPNSVPPPTTAEPPVVPAPWRLRGRGYVLVYRFPAKFLWEQGFLAGAAHQIHPRFGEQRALGAVMLVDYQASGVGPYRELLFIPGLFRFAGQWVATISKIYVSTPASQLSGVHNWGIPKELATFDLRQINRGL